MPNGNAFVAGPSIAADGNFGTYEIDVATGQWTPLPPGAGSGFKGGSAAMYLPGKILKCGSRETEYDKNAVATTRIIDLTAANPLWQSSPPMRHPRVYHNLTLLPGGDLLATGGLGLVNATANQQPVFEPELWRPPDAQHPQGVWYFGPGGTLASSPLVRGYHSVSLLLPDARILVSGGNHHDDATKIQVYCPPYLFRSDGTLAARPEITGAPAEIRWGQTITVCVTDTANIRGACLIRPGAVTHGFDQNQRHVPLQIAGHAGDAESPQRLFLTGPESAFEAPPGYYLLFLTGSADGADVPSIARWVRLDGPGGADLCDVVAPGTPELVPDILGPTEIWLAWEAPGDDAEIIPSGAAVGYDLRQALSPISTEAAWNAATPATGPDPLPVPWPHPTGQTFGVTGLAECTSYSFALRATDDHASISQLQSPAFTVSTTCGGAGGGTSARRTRDEEGARTYSGSGPAESRSGAAPGVFSGGRVAQAASSELQRTPGALVAETRRVDERTWRITLRLATQADGLDLTGSDVTVEREADEGGHERLARHAPGAGENLLGLAALRERGRVAIRSFVRLDRVVPRFQRRGRDLALIEAHHSRLGSLGPAFVAEGGRPELSDGDRIELTYAEAGEASSGSPAWYLLLYREGGAAPIPFSQRRGPSEALPVRFALHPGGPNPTAGATSIRFDLPVESPVTLAVFDLLGRRVVPLTEGVMPAGSHRVQWDLRDASGARVRPGVYVYRLTAGSFRARGKVSVVP